MTLLYKYRTYSSQADFDKVVSLLNGEFWFPSAAEVNDPFEFRCAVDFAYSMEDTIKAFAVVERATNKAISQADALRKVLRVFSKVSEEKIRERQWELSLNLWRGLASQITMCCLAGTATSTLLWSHYARGHTGVAIEMDPRGLEKVTYRVEYSDEIKAISPLLLVDPRFAGSDSLFQTLFLRKATCWQYEEEYRIMRRASASHAQTFERGSVRRIILGCAMPAEMRQRIVSWVSGNAPQIGVALALPSYDRSYSLRIVDA